VEEFRVDEPWMREESALSTDLANFCPAARERVRHFSMKVADTLFLNERLAAQNLAPPKKSESATSPRGRRRQIDVLADLPF
jgi:hypothetical protein